MISNALLSVVLLFGGFVWVAPGSAADAKPAWQLTWEKTVAAAKKEGRLNFYVGRYGSETLLNEFRKEFPEIKIVSTNGAGNSLGTRIVAEARAGNIVADLYSGGAVTNFEFLYKGKVLDSIKSALMLPEVLDESKWYGGKHRYNDPEQQHVFIYIANPTSASIYYNTSYGQSQGFQIVLGSSPAQVERQIRLPRADRNWHRAVAAVFLLSSGARAGVFAQAICRSAAGLFERPPPDDRLAGPGKIRACAWAAAIRKRPTSRDCRWMIWTWSIGRKARIFLPAAVLSV